MHFSRIKVRSLGRSATGTISKAAQLALLLCGLLGIGSIEAASKNVCRDPRGPAESYDPGDPYAPKRVVKGGSFLCNPSYCESYRPSARGGTPPDTGSYHTGFRCVISGDNSQVTHPVKSQSSLTK